MNGQPPSWLIRRRIQECRRFWGQQYHLHLTVFSFYLRIVASETIKVAGEIAGCQCFLTTLLQWMVLVNLGKPLVLVHLCYGNLHANNTGSWCRLSKYSALGLIKISWKMRLCSFERDKHVADRRGRTLHLVLSMKAAFFIISALVVEVSWSFVKMQTVFWAVTKSMSHTCFVFSNCQINFNLSLGGVRRQSSHHVR